MSLCNKFKHVKVQ